MSSGSPLLIDLAGVARLADVQRPVVSMWRSRLARTADPFPPPHAMAGERPLFEAASVASWLTRTRHGNNPDAVADAAAAAAPPDFDLSDARHVACIDALLTAHSLSGDGIQAAARLGLQSFAEEHDPADDFLASELSHARPAWIRWAEQLADAAYSGSAASLMLERRHASTRSTDASAGALTATGEEALITLVDAARARGPFELPLSGISPNLASRLATLFGGEALVPDAPGARAIRRRLILNGQLVVSAADAESAGAPRLTVARLLRPNDDVA